LYRAAIAEAFEPAPFDPAEHDGHNLISAATYGNRDATMCAECPTRLIPRRTT